jgi:anti-sigma factor RsiW
MKRNLSNAHLEDTVLLAYLDGELSRRLMRTAAQHLQNCWACRSSLAELERQAQIISRLLINHDESDTARKQNAKAKFLERKKRVETERADPPTIDLKRLLKLKDSLIPDPLRAAYPQLA